LKTITKDDVEQNITLEYSVTWCTLS